MKNNNKKKASQNGKFFPWSDFKSRRRSRLMQNIQKYEIIYTWNMIHNFDNKVSKHKIFRCNTKLILKFTHRDDIKKVVDVVEKCKKNISRGS